MHYFAYTTLRYNTLPLERYTKHPSTFPHPTSPPRSYRNLAGLCRLPQVQRHKSAAALAAAARSAVAPWGAAMSALNDSATGRLESLRALFTRLLRRRLFQRSIKEMWRLWRGLVGAPTVLRKRIWRCDAYLLILPFYFLCTMPPGGT